ncbi:hypothetical protein [Actinoplanes subglobosus]|uniref:Uncharacterized protein n=1 Tax=Actinoplanes subglobosus TaxID=1547892 RepID=A0ABV8IQ37_9ACTN
MATTPLELLGAGAGLSVIDPGTILTRLWYFDGKFLRAEGFRTDQDYVRSLAALSHQATGSGVVHGYDVSRPGGDTLRITGGLALAGSGRVAYLPRQADLSIRDLIARSSGEADPSEPAAPGVADFRRCAPVAPAGPDVTLAGRPLYLLTVAGAEALCGEEERFGQLCADACATGTDRSTVVEGVTFRLRELTLTLPVSSSVPFDDRHLRSRVASAFFAAEREAVPPRISRTGLATPVWCAGAAAAGGDEVPLAVLDRAGDVTTLLDAWTARRELQESSPRRYWQWRMAMRPWDVFLAQLLQFQCQLLDLGDATPEDDRQALRAAADALGRVTADPEGRIAAVRERLARALDAAPAAGTGSLLLDAGIVELPPAGYLPIDVTRPVQDQIRAFVGPGVDLRFCVARPDQVPEMLQEAQHLDRISLTRGLDDPDRRETVDVLVPDGVIGTAAPATTAFTGTVRILTGRGAAGDESVLALSTVARDRSGPGWSWTAAAYGELPRQTSVGDLARASVAALFGLGGDDPFAGLHLHPDAGHDRGTAAFTGRLTTEARAATARRATVAGAAAGRVPADRPLADGVDRPVMMWLDGFTRTPVDQLGIGRGTEIGARFTLYSRASTRPVLNDVRLTGNLLVTDVLTLADRTVVRSVVNGVTETLTATSEESQLRPVRNIPVVWTFVPQSGALTVAVGDPQMAVVELREAGTPRHVTGALLRGSRIAAPRPIPLPRPIPDPVIGPALAALEMQELGGALDPGSGGRLLAESVIAVLGAELAAPHRDPQFTRYATERLLGGLAATGPEQVTATEDWVFFSRRRDRRCAGDVPVTPVETRTYRLFHRRLAAGAVEGLGSSLRGAVEGFEEVATLQFTAGQVTLASPVADLRAAWRATDRGEEITVAAVGDFSRSDGQPIALGRLAAVRSVLADLADSSGAEVSYLDEIPAPFHQPGLHGAMFTIGVTRQVTTCVTIFRMSREQWKRVIEVMREAGDTMSMNDVLQRAQAPDDRFVASLTGNEITNADEILRAWDQTETFEAVFAWNPAFTDEQKKQALERVAKVAGLIRVRTGFAAELKAQTGKCEAVIVVANEPIFN